MTLCLLNQVLVLLTVWAGAKVVLENKIGISITVVSKGKHWAFTMLWLSAVVTLEMRNHSSINHLWFSVWVWNSKQNFKQLGFWNRLCSLGRTPWCPNCLPCGTKLKSWACWLGHKYYRFWNEKQNPICVVIYLVGFTCSTLS